MKHPTAITSLSFLLVLAASAGCGGSKTSTTSVTSTGSGAAMPPPVACTDEGAGHDFAGAKALAAGAFDGCTGTDADVYSVLAPDHAPGTLYDITLRAVGGNVVGTVFDQDQHELGSASIEKGNEQHLFVVLATNSKMMIQVVGAGAQVQPYAITTKASPLLDEDEANDTVETARPLNLATPRTALLQTAANNSAGSVDYYRVLVGKNGTLHVSVQAGTDEVSLAVAILDRAGKRIGEATAANPGAAVTVDARVKRGEFVIEVSQSGDAPKRAFSVGESPRYLADGYEITVTRK